MLVVETTIELMRSSDLDNKLTEYAKSGIPEYIIIYGLPQSPEVMHFILNQKERCNTPYFLKLGTFLQRYLGNVALSDLF